MAVGLLRGLEAACRGAGANVLSCLSLGLALDFAERKGRLGEFTRWSNERVRELAEAFTCEAAGPLVEAARRYLQAVRGAMEAAYGSAMLFHADVGTRLSIHVRWPYMPLEMAVAWHPVLNLPYIPATSIRGALRAYAESRGLRPCGLAPSELFGDVAESGLLVVTDAYPTACGGKRLVEPDIVNPHYREAEGRVAEHQANPTPILYPTVAGGVTLTFAASLTRRVGSACLEQLRGVVAGALEEGLGARTRLGYGVLRLR